MWWRSLLATVLVAAVAAGCQVRPLYLDDVASGAFSPVPDLRAVVVEEPRLRGPRRRGRTAPGLPRIEQVLRNELLFLFRGDGGGPDEERYFLRTIVSASTDPLAVDLEEDLPAAVLVTLNATFILSEIETDETLLTGSSTATASYDFSSQRFSNERAEKDAAERAARQMAQNIASRLAAYFAARRSDT
jgi:LPS-assembly lipoprotein